VVEFGHATAQQGASVMRVIIINPWNQTVTEADHTGDYRDYYRLLSGPTLDGFPDAEIDCFDIAQIGDPDGHFLFVDDNGLYGDPQAYFTLGSTGSVFAGRGVIACSGDGDDEIGATLSVKDVLASVKWVPIGTVVDPGQPVIEHFDDFDAMIDKLGGPARDRTPLI
jgi:hypothetical protein